MKTLILFAFLLISNLTESQSYSGTIAPASPSAGETITVNFSLISGSAVPNLIIYVYNSTTLDYSTLPTTSTFSSTGYYAYYTIPLGTPNNTILQFTIGTNTTPPTYYGIVQSTTVLPIIFKDYTATFNGMDKIALKWQLESTSGIDKSIIYRSTDGNLFTQVATIKGNINQNDYSYIDTIDNNSSYFYKIAGVGLDGDKIFSSTLFIYANGNNITLPKVLNNSNISNEIILTGINLTNYKTGDINIIDVLGRKYPLSILSNNTIGINNLKSGLYYLKIGNNKPLSFMAR